VFSKHIGTQVLGSDVYHTHNIVLNILVGLGAVGLILSILLTFNILKGVNYKDPRINIPVIISLHRRCSIITFMMSPTQLFLCIS
jgi:O-antigen ligase